MTPISPQREYIIEVLQRQWPDLAPRYEGVIRVLADEDNPFRISMAAYGLREFCEGVATKTGMPRPVRTVNADELKTRLQVAEREAESCPGECLRHVTEPISKLIADIREFFAYSDRWAPRNESAIAVLDLHGVVANDQDRLKELRREWTKLVELFNKVLHGSTSAEGKLIASMETLEGILLELVRPQPSRTLAAIDSILEEAERDA